MSKDGQNASGSVIHLGWVCLCFIVCMACATDRLEDLPAVETPDADTMEDLDSPPPEPDVLAPDDDIVDEPEPECLDLDGDGSPGTGEGCQPELPGWDCDDNDPGIGPGVPEVCDGVDNNCDGQADEGTVNECGGCGVLDGVPGQPCGLCGTLVCEGEEELTCMDAQGRDYYEDRDEDGFGAGEPVESCEPVGRFSVTEGGDCDDNDADRHPDAQEVCDGQDNDCDPQTGEVSVCQVIHLPSGGDGWEPLVADFDDEDAPQAPVRAAFDMESLGRAWLITDSTWHVLLLANGAWVDSGPLEDKMPEVAQVGQVRYAYAIPASHLGGLRPMIIVVAGGSVFIYEYQVFQNSFDLMRSEDESPWESALAPQPDDVNAAWLDAQHGEDWFSARPGDLCQVNNDPPLAVILVLGTASHQHVLESGHCFDFIERVPNGGFAPFSMPDAPEPASVRAAFWQQGLYLIKAP